MTQIKLQKPHPAQMEIFTYKKRPFKVLNCGRRFGKTELSVAEMYEPVLKFGGTSFYVAPTFGMTLKMWRRILTDLGKIAVFKSAQERLIVLPNGGSIQMFSADKAGDKIRGNAANKVVVDEAAMIPNLMEMWESSILPTLMDKKDQQGEAIFMSTPRGIGNDWHNLYQKELTDKRFKSFKFKSIDNPYINVKAILAMKDIVSERFYRQEFEADFIEDAGEVFRGVLNAAIGYQKDPYPGDFVFGIDVARKNDFTVIIIMDINTREVVHMTRMNNISFHGQKEKIKSLYDQWQPHTVACEENSMGLPFIEELQMMRIPVVGFRTTNKSKKEIIDLLARDIEKGNITLLNDRDMVNELQAYTQSVTELGSIKFSAPSGVHDDIVMALAICNYYATKSGGVFGVGLPMIEGFGIG